MATTNLKPEAAGIIDTEAKMGPKVQSGSGAPNHAAPKGTLYVRKDASGEDTRLYINTDGNTTWASFTASA
jgi:hypothetical protein